MISNFKANIHAQNDPMFQTPSCGNRGEGIGFLYAQAVNPETHLEEIKNIRRKAEGEIWKMRKGSEYYIGYAAIIKACKVRLEV